MLSFCSFAQSVDVVKLEADADTLMNKNEPALAIPKYTTILKQNPTGELYLRALYKRAYAYYYTQQHALAIDDLTLFLDKIPTHFQALVMRALCYQAEQKIPEQLQDVEAALLLRDDSQLVKWKTSLLVELKKWNEAEAYLRTLLQDSPDSQVALQMAMVKYNQQGLDSALHYVNKAIELDYRDASAYYYGASFCLQKEKYKQAKEYSTIALALDPDNVNFLFYHGIAEIELGNKKEGCRCMQKAFDGGQDDAKGYLIEYCYEASKY